MPDMNDLPWASDVTETPEDREALVRLRDEVEALRLRTPEDNIKYWLSDEAMDRD